MTIGGNLLHQAILEFIDAEYPMWTCGTLHTPLGVIGPSTCVEPHDNNTHLIVITQMFDNLKITHFRQDDNGDYNNNLTKSIEVVNGHNALEELKKILSAIECNNYK